MSKVEDLSPSKLTKSESHCTVSDAKKVDDTFHNSTKINRRKKKKRKGFH